MLSGVLLISDSMTRDVEMPRNVRMSVHPGASVNRISDSIIRHHIPVRGFQKILLHIGVIDILNIHESKDSSYRNIEFKQLMRRFSFLLRVIRWKNPSALILVSGILPVPKYHEAIGLKIRSINFALHVISAKFCNCLYVDTSSAYLFDLKPIKKYFYDGLHLSYSGSRVLSSRFRQALCPMEILKLQVSKKNILMMSYPVCFE